MDVRDQVARDQKNAPGACCRLCLLRVCLGSGNIQTLSMEPGSSSRPSSPPTVRMLPRQHCVLEDSADEAHDRNATARTAGEHATGRATAEAAHRMRSHVGRVPCRALQKWSCSVHTCTGGEFRDCAQTSTTHLHGMDPALYSCTRNLHLQGWCFCFYHASARPVQTFKIDLFSGP